MKKQIAILATIIAATGFSAFGQDWITVSDSLGNYSVWDNFSGTKGANVGESAGAGDVNIEVLWALNGTSDPLAALTANGASPTNGVTSVASTAQADIANMLSGGWTLAQNFASGSGSAALGTVETTTTGTTGAKGGGVAAYNGGNPFEVDTTSTGLTGSTIELLYIAFNGTASSYSSATAFGWSALYEESIGLTAGDINSTDPQTFGAANGNAIGVDPVPEPATIALAGLGGLSMLFLRRRKS